MSDAERDAYLEVALRHAPDAGIDAPASLSAAILREARGAAARAAPRRAWSGMASDPSGAAGLVAALLRFWAWLARPPVAGAFASLMVATLAGVMWWGEPIERTLELPLAKADSAPAAPVGPVGPAVPEARVAAAERVAPVPAVTRVEPPPALTERSVALADAGGVPQARQRAQAAPRVADPPAVAAARATLQSSPPQVGNAAATDSAARLAKQAQASPGAARVPADAGSPAAAAPAPAAIGGTPAPDEPARLFPPARANPATPQAKERADEARASVAAAVSSNAAPPADVPPPHAAAEVAQQAPAKLEAEKAAREMNAMIPQAAAPSAEGARPPAAVARAETRRRVEVQASNLGRLAAGAPHLSAKSAIGTRPLFSLQQSLSTRGESWSWHVGTAMPRPVDAALRQWLARLDAAAGDHWQDAAVPGDAQAPGIVLELLLDGRPRARIQLDSDAVRFSDNADPARPLRAVLPAPVAQDLRTVLEALAR
jgi:hypothetical protein